MAINEDFLLVTAVLRFFGLQRGGAHPQSAGARPSPSGAVIYFDGVCALCNGFVDWVMARDRAGVFQFAPLQGQTAQERLGALPATAGLREALFEETDGGTSDPLLARTTLRSVVLVDDRGVALRSTAVMRILAGLGGVWRLSALLRLCPAPLRDVVYDAIAKNRYDWFGIRETCRLPTPEDAHRILP